MNTQRTAFSPQSFKLPKKVAVKMPSNKRTYNWILLLTVSWLLQQASAGQMVGQTAGRTSGSGGGSSNNRFDRKRRGDVDQVVQPTIVRPESAVNADYFKSDQLRSDNLKSEHFLSKVNNFNADNVDPNDSERKRSEPVDSVPELPTSLSRATLLSFTNAEPLPISKGQTLSPSPSRSKVTRESDSRSLSNRSVNGASVQNSTIPSLSNDVHKFETLAPLATNSPTVNSFIQNANSDDRLSVDARRSAGEETAKDKRDMFARRPLGRTRRRLAAPAAQLAESFDDQVIRFHRERKSINMAGNPKLYEALLKSKRSSDGVESITIGAILPKTALITKFRSYQKRLQDAVEDLMGSKNGVFHFLQRFRIAQAQLVLLSRNPTPTEILSALCDKLLPHNVSTIIYMSNSDTDDSNAASALYLMQLTSYLGIPSKCIDRSPC